MCTTISASTFIEQTLIGEYGGIVNEGKHDYLSFLLIACGIEFLGRCMEPMGTDWQLHKYGGQYFKDGITLFPECYQKKSDIPNQLYLGLRCGICHSLLLKVGIIVSSTDTQNLDNTPILLNIHTFYQDFKSACEKLLNEPKYQKRLSEPFISISNDTTTGETENNIYV